MRTADGWFQTHKGVQFFPLDPRPEDIRIEDIAHALSHVCRFGGHTRSFYSVAQHCELASRFVAKGFEREALMHDAAEAYLGDMVRPLKLQMPDYVAVEAKLERVIADLFGLRYPWPKEVKDIDNVLLMTERRDLLAVEREWPKLAEPLPFEIFGMHSNTAERMFMARFEELFHERAK